MRPGAGCVDGISGGGGARGGGQEAGRGHYRDRHCQPSGVWGGLGGRGQGGGGCYKDVMGVDITGCAIVNPQVGQGVGLHGLGVWEGCA